MKAKFGAIVVAGSGKLGGHVFSKNRGGAFMRTKVTPANARTSFQTAVRNRFAGLSQAWRSLSDSQRLAWNAAVIDFARTDVFGDLRNPSGINLYQRLNNLLLQIDQPVLLTPPTPDLVQALSLTQVFVDSATSKATLTFDEAIGADMSVIISATPAVSPGKYSINSLFRQIAVLTATDVAPIEVFNEYIAKFGAFGEAGRKIYFRALVINNFTGMSGVATIAYGTL